ncbi:MAG: hypothetical protein ACFFBP_06040 [Promethearchaeota archaeon]
MSIEISELLDFIEDIIQSLEKVHAALRIIFEMIAREEQQPDFYS